MHYTVCILYIIHIITPCYVLEKQEIFYFMLIIGFIDLIQIKNF